MIKYHINLNEPDINLIKIQKFPDGQQNVLISKDIVSYASITTRLRNWMDLELLVCTVASLRENDPNIQIDLGISYFVGARSDRKFSKWNSDFQGNNYLKSVICPIINSLNFKEVCILNPHSNCLEMGINGFSKAILLENDFISTQIRNIVDFNKLDSKSDLILISPDAGASHKVIETAENLNYKGNIVTCQKERDSEGKLTKVVVPLKEGLKDDSIFVIIDDICDGGRTFINIAKEIKNQNSKFKIYLIVTHGIFSNGFEELSKYFNNIFYTNSYSDIEIPNCFETKSLPFKVI